MSSTFERKLAAIMFTDIAEFTAISGQDEQKALGLIDQLKSITSPLIKEFKGTLHKELGDGFLYSFNTVTDSIRCAIKIQKSIKGIEDFKANNITLESQQEAIQTIFQLHNALLSFQIEYQKCSHLTSKELS